jgi:UDP-N-acetyl-2-amino-2-deoxyglucuronate dehydrogenase
VIRHVGILGAGGISETHARAAAAVPDLRVVAVCGRDASRVAALAGRHGAAPFTDIHAFLRHRPLEIVAIGTPSGVHADDIEAAAGQGLHVLCEKPLDVTTARIDRMLEVVANAGVTLGVFFQDRSTPDLMDVKDALVAGRLGRPILADARVKWYRPPEYYAQSLWRGTWALDGGGALMNQGVHTVDLLLWLLGDVRRVYARTLAALHAIEVEDTAVAVLEFANGAVATLEATTAAWPGYDRRVAITGTLGTVVIEQARVAKWDLREPALEGAAGGAAVIAPGPPPGAASAGAAASTHVVADASAHRRVFEDFVSALDAGRPPRVDGREGRRSVALIEAIYASSRSGQPVDVAS